MLQYFIVIALALQVCVFAENNQTKISFSNLKCSNGTYEEKSLYDKYEEMLDVYVQKKTNDTFEKLKDAFKAFVTKIDSSCANNSLDNIENTPVFIRLIEYAVKNGNYSKFIKSGGDKCVSTAKKYIISQCINNDTIPTTDAPVVSHSNASGPANGTGESGKPGSGTNGGNGTTNNNSLQTPDLGPTEKHQLLFQDLLKMAYLHFDESNCDLTEEIRTCVKNVMEDNRYNSTCKPEHSEFVDSLFGFTKNMCPSSPADGQSAQTGGVNSFLFNPVVILLPLVGIMLLK